MESPTCHDSGRAGAVVYALRPQRLAASWRGGGLTAATSAYRIVDGFADLAPVRTRIRYRPDRAVR